MKYPFISLKEINKPYEKELQEAADKVIASGWYLRGQSVDNFEKELADYCNVKNIIACSNGLDALRLILKAYISLGTMKPGDEVIVPGNTFIASVLAISDNGLIPVFAEPSEKTYNLDTDKLEKYITQRTKAIMVVHLYGAACWDEKLYNTAKKYNLKVIEDNAQAIAATADLAGFSGQHNTGALGDAAAFSFYPTKNLGALGDAGAVATNDCELAERVRALANYGSTKRYFNPFQGYNCRMDEVQAAMLSVKLKHLDSITRQRRERAAIYEAEITNPLVGKPLFREGNVWHQYVVTVSDRNKFRAYLESKGVETDLHYPTPPHMQPCYNGYAHEELPITESLAERVVSLPITEGTPLEHFHEIAQIINEYNG